MAKKITNRAQLVGGQFYIRAIVNAYGMPLLEAVQLAGKPRRYSGHFDVLKDRYVIDLITPSFRGYSRKESFVGDLGVESCHEEVALFPFSNKLVLRLKELMNDKRKFAEFLNGRTFSEEDWEHAEWHWKSIRQLDDLDFDSE